MIGFPEFILDDKELDDVYDGVGAWGQRWEGMEWDLQAPPEGEVVPVVALLCSVWHSVSNQV